MKLQMRFADPIICNFVAYNMVCAELQNAETKENTKRITNKLDNAAGS